jgi:hypothetical protein
LIGGPGFHFGPNVLQEFGTALRDAVRNTLPWYPLAFVMAFLALWLVDSNVSVPQSRWNVVLAKVAATGLAGGIVMGFAGCLTSYISLSNSVSDFARSNNLEITGRITDAVIYVSIFIAALIAFFSTVLYLIVQLSTVYLDGTHSLAGKSLKDLNQKFLVWLDPAGEAGFYEPADTRLDPANQRSTGRWVQFPEGTVVRWSDTVCIGDTYTGRAGIISASDGIRYEGFNGRISGRAPFVANLEVAEHFAQPAAARVT